MRYKLCLSIIIIASMAILAFAREMPSGNPAQPRQRPQLMQLATDEKTHEIGQLWFTVSNWGFFGSSRGEDNPLQCIIYEQGEHAGECRPSAEYPGGSGIEYLFQGALWIGAVVAGDTLVSVGEDGWFANVNELFPGYNQETDTIMENSIFWDSTAISEQDFIGEMTDTIRNSDYVDPTHIPIGIKVKQRSVAWSYDYARNFIIIDYWFTNVREDREIINDTYIGIYIDGDVGHVDKRYYAQDDVTGFMDLYYDPVRDDSVFVKTAWLADNDGDPTDDGRFDEQSCTGALGVAILKVADIPLDQLKYSYNWWVSHTEEDQGAANDRDWGPMWAVNERIWGWDGTPENDRMKYQVMSNGEFDYNQTDIERFSGEDPWGECPSSLIDKLRGGYDTRFLFSFGPFDIGPDDTIQVAIAVMVAEGFHNDPNNVGMPPLGTVPEGWNPDKFQYEDIAKSASWVRTIYDNDYKGPMPPPRPPFEVETYDNKIDIFWKPDTCFNYIDEITKLQDFEGFRIYVGEANMESYYTPIVEYDRVDFIDYNSTDTFHLDTIYSVMRSDLFPTDPNLTLDTVYRWDGDSVIEDIFDRRPFGTNCGMPTDSVFRYGERYYKYTLTNQRQGSDVYIAVTAYDFGQPTRELKSLESSKTYNYLWVVPKGPTGESEKAGGVYVFPNPYRIDHDYAGRTGGDWETPVGREWTEYSRKIRFANLPRKSIIRIYTVDGDLVDEIEHYDPNYLPQDLNFDGDEKDMLGAEDWDLINKNDQSIASGIYMFSVENIETGEYELGKFVIIK